ncbi:MAG: MFS transporter [Gammaproteobacteria bacterium]|nr:MFS transporter [Gammaproteobacteria bacterium]
MALDVNSNHREIPHKNFTILSLAVSQTLNWAGLFYVFPALLIFWETDLGWSRVEITGALTLAIVMSGLGSPICGKLIDLGQGPLMMTSCILLGSLGLFGVSIINTIFGFYFFWALIGISFAGCLYDPCFALITRSQGRDAKHSITRITIIAGFAGTLSFPCAYFLTEALGWREAVRIFAAFVPIASAPIAWVAARQLEKYRHEESPIGHPVMKIRSGFVSPMFLCLGIGFAFLAIVHGAALHHFLPLVKERSIPAGTAVFAVSLIGPMQVVGRLILSFLKDRITHHAISMSSFLIMGTSMLALLAISSAPELIFLFVVMFGGGYGLVSIIRPVIARDILGEANFGVNYGVITLIYMMGSAVSPFLGSLIWEFGGYDLLLYWLMVFAGLGVSLYAVSYSIAQHRHPSIQN